MTIQERLDERYGRTPRRVRRTAWVVGGLLAAAVVGWFSWSTATEAAGTVDFDDRGFTVLGDHEVSVSFQVTSTVDRPIACALEALDVEFGVVGWRIVEYPVSETVTTVYTESVATVAEATTGIVKSCWVP
ncbi:DUF4307 domain-containing protein [Microbacterium betulae]|uniref:DUF4307 domain-containing protein n=1 Tax=Microbacterium betulae TaxID=2981139 RepID=A0AA97FJY8_9MICO|nr:DUF4307 domain-containing protein [Microbacterium sp. AB]WOF24373.1 DUF4307 domain-containing protein [Microbacterium sp. AB]